MNTKTENREHILTRTNDRDLKFRGVKIAGVANLWDDSGTGRKTELDLYKTTGGNFVCQKSEYTKWCGDSHTFTAKLCKTEKDVMSFFGQSDLAQELYDNAKIDNCEIVN